MIIEGPEDAPHPIQLVDPNPDWPRMFEQEKALLMEHLGQFIERIEHIGSTAVGTIRAKPIIDLVILVKEGVRFSDQMRAKCLKKCGYNSPAGGYKGNPWTHKLHIRDERNGFWEEAIHFRDALRADIQLAKDYECVKMQSAVQHGKNPDWRKYNEPQWPFFANVLANFRNKTGQLFQA
ncbi:MAG: GrpB family protein [Verrucomicrobia bacterium]|nr:GrpB family protein [Verrucomicrobiota bacterium]